MLAELLYFVSIALFGFVILGAAQLPNDMWLVVGLFPVFLAMILGFMMWVYASVRVRPAGEHRLAAGADRRRGVGVRGLSTRNLFIAICAIAVDRPDLRAVSPFWLPISADCLTVAQPADFRFRPTEGASTCNV